MAAGTGAAAEVGAPNSGRITISGRDLYSLAGWKAQEQAGFPEAQCGGGNCPSHEGDRLGQQCQPTSNTPEGSMYTC